MVPNKRTEIVLHRSIWSFPRVGVPAKILKRILVG